MRTVRDNLADFASEQVLTRNEVEELVGLKTADLDAVLDGVASYNCIARFCMALGITFESLCSDGGFVMNSLENQYNGLPMIAKQSITNVFCKQLTARLGKDFNLKAVLEASIPEHKLFVSRILSGNSVLPAKAIPEIRVALSRSVGEKEFNEMFATTMCSRISNYNYNKARDHFHLTASDVAHAIHTSISNAGNWTMNGTPISIKFIPKVAELFGNFNPVAFATKILTDADLEGKELSDLDLKKKQEQAFGTLVEYKYPENVLARSERIAHERAEKEETKKLREQRSAIVLPTAIAENEDDRPSRPESLVRSSNNTLDLADEITAKMFNALSRENKAEVGKLIAELFFAQIKEKEQ